MKILNYTIILLTSLLLAWLLPMLYSLATAEAGQNIFSYYSSVEKSFCTIDFDDTKDKLIRKNIKTNYEYTEAEFDSILPLFYSRQLLADGRMPETIHGIPVPPKEIRRKNFFYRTNPSDKNRPRIPVYTLFESFSGRVNLEMPGDVFRLNNKIEFIDPETNSVKKEKSELFMKAFLKRNFAFPAKFAAGNPSTRKPYDEGYFIIDNNDRLFHLKMVNGKPFLKNINISSNIKPVYITVMEPDDRSFYAFMFDSNHKLYSISTNNYELEEIPCPQFNLNKDRLMIMANMLYWNVNVIAPEGKLVYALDAKNKSVVDSAVFKRELPEKAFIRHILPFTLSFEASNTKYVFPKIKTGSAYIFIFNILFTILFITINVYRKKDFKLIPTLWIACTGLFGFIPSIILQK